MIGRPRPLRTMTLSRPALVTLATAGLLAAAAAQAADVKPAANASAATATTPSKSTTTSAGAAPLGVGGSVTTSSGLVFKLIKAGQGPSPKATDTVRVHYRGTLADGKEFDSSYRRGKPLEFPLDQVIRCWTEGVQRLQVGGTARLTCPPALAYGEQGVGGVIPPNATLTFEVELLGIVGR
jgi:FKBP-type peptidyl-prolyl cis-trans isomerase FkpA